MLTTRPAAVAGMFYPADPAELRVAVDRLLAAAAPASRDAAPVKALIVPHAGYVYSGPVAASAYAQLAATAAGIRRVVLLGPAHRVPLSGLALPGVDGFATPLGTVAVDAAGAALARRLPQVADNAPAHAAEHSLEVQLPFLQRVLGEFDLVPLVVGAATRRERRGSPRPALGRPGDADRRQLRSVALPPVPRSAVAGPRGRGHDPRPRAAPRPRGGLRRHAGQRAAARGPPARAHCPRSSTCAIPATPRATGGRSSATPRSASRPQVPMAPTDLGRRAAADGATRPRCSRSAMPRPPRRRTPSSTGPARRSSR